VEDYQSLIADVNPDAKIVLLDHLVGRHPANSRQSSGRAECRCHPHRFRMELTVFCNWGPTRLDTLAMAKTYSDQLSEIGKHLGADADILVYGCDFAKRGRRKGRRHRNYQP
jgi:hypothetical protein